MARFGFLVSLLYFCEMIRASYRFILITLMLIMPCVVMASSNDKKDLLVISRVYDYSMTVSDSIEGTTSLSYFKYLITTNQRNPLMFCIPRLYNIAKGDNRTFFGEQFDRQTFHEKREDESVNIAKVSTIRRRHSVLPNLQDYLTPQIYKPTIIHNDILSPFHRLNRRYYKYDVAYLSDSVARISFRPRMRNTQTLKGHAIVQIATGRIDSCRLEGEFLNYRNSIPSDFKVMVKVNKQDFLRSVDRVALMIVNEQVKNPIRMKFKDSAINMSCVTPIGRAEDICFYDGECEYLEIGFNDKYLMDAVKNAPSETIMVCLNSGSSPCILKSGDDDGKYTYMILPVRLKAE